MNLRKYVAVMVVVLLGACPLAAAHGEEGAPPEPRSGAQSEAPPEPKSEAQTLALPFPFYNENFGAAVGVVYGLNGFPEKHSRLIGTAMAGTNGAAMLFLAGQDLRPPGLARLFIDPVFSIG